MYVPVSEMTPANPYLKVPNRDIKTPQGLSLTLVNPAYMTRQVNEMDMEMSGFNGHITSLNPLRPENRPDRWEAEALKTFERGIKETGSIEMTSGKEYFRFMRPFVTEKSCLKCHAIQGYKEGDIRGGISVSIPMEPLRAIEKSRIIELALAHSFLWIIGLIGLGAGTRRLWIQTLLREKLENQNRQLQKSESLSRMAASIAHIFNNQLGVIIGNLEMVIGDQPKSAPPSSSLTEAMKGAWKAADMSGLMLTYLGQSLDKLEPLDLSSSCNKILPVLKAALPENVILETDFSSPGPVINTNTDYLQQILTNLLTNAWEACGKHRGIISLSVKKVASAEIPTAHRFPIDWQPQNNTCACLEVTDTGSGIEDKDIEKICDPFYTSKFTGRGMGLAVVLGIVKTHKGVLTVESKAKQGSTFRVFFPLSE